MDNQSCCYQKTNRTSTSTIQVLRRLCLQERKKEHTPVTAQRKAVVNRKTELEDKSKDKSTEHFYPSKRCPLHPKCRTFRSKPMKERINILVKHRICFKCCNSSEHFSRNCTEKVSCSVCACDSHPSALHLDNNDPQGGEKKRESETKTTVNNKCARICNDIPVGNRVLRQFL